MKKISHEKTTPQIGKSFHQRNARNKHWVERRQIQFAKNTTIKHVPGLYKVHRNNKMLSSGD